MSKNEEKKFQIQRVYVKDVSFEAPGTPDVFLDEWNPKINVQLNNNARRIGEGTEYEVEVNATVTATHDEKTVYLAEVRQAGIFTVEGLEGEELDHLLGAYCPGILFPYLRQTVSELITRGSFPPFLMQPINFEVLYRDARAKREQEKAESESGGKKKH